MQRIHSSFRKDITSKTTVLKYKTYHWSFMPRQNFKQPASFDRPQIYVKNVLTPSRYEFATAVDSNARKLNGSRGGKRFKVSVSETRFFIKKIFLIV